MGGRDVRTLLGNSLALAKDRTPAALAWGPRLALYALLFAALVFLPLALGVCSCTMFGFASIAMVLGAALLVGSTAFGALTIEREKKTLDSLRLTQLTASQIAAAKLWPEMRLLGRLLLAFGPTVLACGALSPEGLPGGVEVLAVAATGGFLSATMALAISSLCDTTSRAVVAGWTLRGVWLLITPVFDLVLGAVLVQEKAVAAFSFLNPLSALVGILVPEASHGTAVWLPFLSPVAMALAGLLLFKLASRRFDNGLQHGASLTDRVVHPIYRRGWGPKWLQSKIPALRSNPAFLREMTAQFRAGAGRWPGYAVFVVLFLAPFFYAKSWAMKDAVQNAMDAPGYSQLQVSHDVTPRISNPVETGTQPIDLGGRNVRLEARDGTCLVMKGHTGNFCSRLYLYYALQVPLPRHEMVVVDYGTNHPSYFQANDPQPMAMTPVDDTTAQMYGLSDADGSQGPDNQLDADSADRLNKASMSVGLAGTVVLLLLYLGIRCSGFLAAAVTGERDRKTWEDLALTGIQPDRALAGKLAGSLLIMAFQMTLAFPVLGFFVMTGNLTLPEMGALYLYALAVMVTAGCIGLWASATSQTSHQAHGKALLCVVSGFLLAPFLNGFVGGLLAGLALLAALGSLGLNRRGQAMSLAGISFSLLLAPKVASPVTAILMFMPSLTESHTPLTRAFPMSTVTGPEAIVFGMAALVFLASLSSFLWNESLRRMSDPVQSTALKADLAA